MSEISELPKLACETGKNPQVKEQAWVDCVLISWITTVSFNRGFFLLCVLQGVSYLLGEFQQTCLVSLLVASLLSHFSPRWSGWAELQTPEPEPESQGLADASALTLAGARGAV